MAGGAVPDCTSCGACCAAGWAVAVELRDDVPRHLTRSVRRSPDFAADDHLYGTRRMAEDTRGRCVALRGEVGTATRCSVYGRRPAACREFARGAEQCLESRQVVGLACRAT